MSGFEVLRRVREYNEQAQRDDAERARESAGLSANCPADPLVAALRSQVDTLAGGALTDRRRGRRH